MHVNTCHTHACTHLHTGTLCCWELVPFVWPQKGPVTGLNGPPAPTEHDSFRQIVPRACLVPVLATSAGQVVRRVPCLGGMCPGAPADPLPAGPGRLLRQPLGKEWQFHAAPRRPSCAPAGPGSGQPCRRPPPSPQQSQPGSSGLLHTEVRTGTVLDLLAMCGCPRWL